MTAYTVIPDADINPDKPIKSATAYALRDNPLSIAEGDASAPSINPAALLIGGKGGDGILNNAAAFSAIGYYEFSSMVQTAARALPICSIIRIAGNASLSAVMTVTNRTNTPAATTQSEQDQAEALDSIFGVTSATNGEGGGSVGADGVSVFSSGANGARGKPLGSVFRPWVSRKPFLGGCAKYVSGGGGGGGSVIVIIEGNFDATGGTITADGQPGTVGNSGGGGAGSVIVICTGTITGGTFNARGGDGIGSGAPGGGGYVALVAAAYSGTQTLAVTGASHGGYTSANGYSEKITLTRDQIRTILQRL